MSNQSVDSAIKIEPKFEPNCEDNDEDVDISAIKIEPNCEDQNDEDCHHSRSKVFEDTCEGVQNGLSCATDVDIGAKCSEENVPPLIKDEPVEGTPSTEGKTILKAVEKKSTYTRQINGITKGQDVKGNRRSTRLEEKKSLDTFKSEIKPSISKCSENVSPQIKDEPAVKRRRTVRVINENMTIQEVIKLFQSEYLRSTSNNFYRKYRCVKTSCEKYLIYRCRVCASEFDKVDSAEEHFEKEHSNSDSGTEYHKEDDILDHFHKLYKCDQCGMAAPILLSFIRHVDSYHNSDGRQYSCDKCSFTTFDWYLNSLHTKSHLNSSCSEKKKTSKSTKKTVECHLCHLSVAVKYIKHHMQSRHTSSTSRRSGIKCPLCPKTFTSISGSIKHQNTVHAVVETNSICKECGKTYKNAESFRTHVRTQHGKNKPHFDCPQCNKTFKSMYGLNFHMNTIHQGIESVGKAVSSQTYSCADCGSGFLKESLLINHIRKEHDPTCDGPEKKHLCETCGKSFELKFLLDRHVVVHTKEKKFVCATCNKGFTQMDSLKTHQVVHTGIKPFECGKCGQKYSQKYPLTLHVKKHHPD